MVSQSVIKRILDFEKTSNLSRSGSSVKCYYNDKVKYSNYVLLKYFNAPTGYALIRFYFYTFLKMLVNDLKQDNVSVPNCYGFCKIGNDYYELQEKADGKPLFVYNPYEAIKKYLDITDESVKFGSFDNLTKQQKNQLFIKSCKQNLQNIKVLRDAPQEHFDKLLRDMLISVKKYDVIFDDNNPENFLYSKEKGFSIIDLDLSRSLLNYINNGEDLEKYKKWLKANDILTDDNKNVLQSDKQQEVVERFIELFTDCAPFSSEISESELNLESKTFKQKLLYKSVDVMKKVIRALENNNIKLTNGEISSIINTYFTEHYNLSNFSEILDSFENIKDNTIKKNKAR